MSLLKKIEQEVDDADKGLLNALNVKKSIEEMLADLESSGSISLEVNSPVNEDQISSEAK